MKHKVWIAFEETRTIRAQASSRVGKHQTGLEIPGEGGGVGSSEN